MGRTSGTLKRMLYKLKGYYNSFQNPNVSLEDLLNINKQYFNSDERVENAIYFTARFYENKLRDDGKSLFLNQHLGDVAKNTLFYVSKNYDWETEELKNVFIASLNHDFVERFPDYSYLLKENFGKDVYDIVLAVTIPKNVSKTKAIKELSKLDDPRPKNIKPQDGDNNVRCNTNISLTLAYNLTQSILKRDLDNYRKNIEFYDNYRPKIIRYNNYLDDYTKITETLPGNLGDKLKRDVDISKACDNLLYKIFREDHSHYISLDKIKIPNLYPLFDKLGLKHQ